MSGDIFLEYVIQNVILVICLDGNKGYKSCQKPILILWPPAGEPNVAINFVLPNSFLIFASVKRKMDGGAAVQDVLSSGVLKRFPTCGRISIREVKNTEMSFSPWHLTGVSPLVRQSKELLLWLEVRSQFYRRSGPPLRGERESLIALPPYTTTQSQLTLNGGFTQNIKYFGRGLCAVMIVRKWCNYQEQKFLFVLGTIPGPSLSYIRFIKQFNQTRQ